MASRSQRWVGLAWSLGLALACAKPQPRSEAPTTEATTEATTEVAPVEPAPSPEPVALVEVEIPEPAPLEPPPWLGNAVIERQILAVQPIVQAAAAEQGLDPNLINGLIWVESGFDPKARGKSGSQGLMQLMPKTSESLAKLLGRKRKPYDPDFNIHAGTLLLKRLLDRFDGDVTLALAAYNRGPGIVAGWVAEGQPLPERTQGFVDRVLRAQAWFQQHPAVAASE